MYLHEFRYRQSTCWPGILLDFPFFSRGGGNQLCERGPARRLVFFRHHRMGDSAIFYGAISRQE